MKILTFGDYNYIPHLINCYRNLKEFNRHNDLIIVSVDQNTVDKIKTIEPTCDVRLFISKKYDYTIYIKHEIIHEYIKIYDKVFYLDSDILIFIDFFNIIEKMLDKYDIILKFYLQADRFNRGNLRNIINTGTIGVKKTENVYKLLDYVFNKTTNIDNFDEYHNTDFIGSNSIKYGNLDEYHYTDFIDNNSINYGIIDDCINLINNEKQSYRIEEIKQLSPMSFHPTYTINKFYPDRHYTKIQVAKALGKWFYD